MASCGRGLAPSAPAIQAGGERGQTGEIRQVDFPNQSAVEPLISCLASGDEHRGRARMPEDGVQRDSNQEMPGRCGVPGVPKALSQRNCCSVRPYSRRVPTWRTRSRRCSW